MLHHHPDSITAAAKPRTSADAGELEAMLLAAARGDDANWNALVARFTARVRKVARLHRLASHDVDDIVQTTWLRLLEHIDGVREPAALGAWLETTARRESLRVIHKAARERPAEGTLDCDEVAEPAAEHALLEAERRAALTAGVERLPSTQQRLIGMLLAHPTMSYTEISQALGTPIGSIGPTRARSLARLRRDPQLLRAIGHAA